MCAASIGKCTSGSGTAPKPIGVSLTSPRRHRLVERVEDLERGAVFGLRHLLWTFLSGDELPEDDPCAAWTVVRLAQYGEGELYYMGTRPKLDEAQQQEWDRLVELESELSPAAPPAEKLGGDRRYR